MPSNFMNQPPPGRVAGPPVTIFIVDDEPMLLELAAAILEPLGYQVRTFSNPQAALEAYPAARPTVIVTDFAMGKVSGLDLIRECKRVEPLQKVLLLSGTVGENALAGSDIKPDAFLAKPYQIKDLVQSVQELAAR